MVLAVIPMPMHSVDVLVLGAGAAGMIAAAEAGRRGRRVLVLDHAAAPGEKIRISGGGRCNFTNLSTDPQRFLSGNPRFAISALSRFTPQDFIARVDRAGIAWHEKALGQLFCDGKATQIVDMLRRDMEAVGVEMWLGCAPGPVAREGRFVVETWRGPVAAQSLVVATGGKSIPKMGASSLGYHIAEQFGLAITGTRPALVPLTLSEADLARFRPLAGLAVEAGVSLGRTAFHEPVLFTHRGLSGPAILQISSYWREGDWLELDLVPGVDLAVTLGALRGTLGKRKPSAALARFMPERLAALVAEGAGAKGNLADQGKAAIAALARAAKELRVRPLGSEGYRTAEVTSGGVDTGELDSRTMAARKVPGLYFVGEVVDVTGWLGGYNFQWAWSSGWVAGQSA